MPFELLMPAFGGRGRPRAGEVRVAIIKNKKDALELVVTVGSEVMRKLGCDKRQRVHLAHGTMGSTDHGKMIVAVADEGRFTLTPNGHASTWRVVTRSLHPSLKIAVHEATVVKHEIAPAPTGLGEGRALILRLPASMVQTGDIMGDGNYKPRRAG